MRKGSNPSHSKTSRRQNSLLSPTSCYWTTKIHIHIIFPNNCFNIVIQHSQNLTSSGSIWCQVLSASMTLGLRWRSLVSHLLWCDCPSSHLNCIRWGENQNPGVPNTASPLSSAFLTPWCIKNHHMQSSPLCHSTLLPDMQHWVHQRSIPLPIQWGSGRKSQNCSKPLKFGSAKLLPKTLLRKHTKTLIFPWVLSQILFFTTHTFSSYYRKCAL